MFVGGHRDCCRLPPNIVVSISLNWSIRAIGPIAWIQPPFIPGSTKFTR